ncbi:MAG: glycine oxidase ThiO [Methylohalobius sp.]|nr:glycine oxidase ThiO [Methylohalobius sp.]
MKCLILGAGISGLLCARELVQSGCQVEIVERGQIGREASWAGGGILSPLYPWRQPAAIERLTQSSGQHYAELSQALKQATGIDPQWQQCGMLWFSLRDLEAAIKWCQKRKIAWQILSPKEVAELQPGIEVQESQALWIPEISQIRNPRLIKSLQQDLRQCGVILKENTPVLGFVRSRERIAAIKTSNGKIEADVFIVTAGAWSSSWQIEEAWQPDIRPIKGQMLLIKAKPNLLRLIVQCDEHYLIPRLDGRILVGSTVEDSGFDKRPTRPAFEELYAFALKTLPILKCSPVELHWAGLRPKAPGGIPYIGRHPEIANLYYNCGHFRNGVAMGPEAAKLLADLVLNRETNIDPQAYLPKNRML